MQPTSEGPLFVVLGSPSDLCVSSPSNRAVRRTLPEARSWASWTRRRSLAAAPQRALGLARHLWFADRLALDVAVLLGWL